MGELRNLDEALVKYRIVPNALTNKNKKTGELLNTMLLKIINNEVVDQDDLNKVESQIRNRSKRSKLSHYHSRIGTIYLLMRDTRKEAIKNYITAIRYYPINFKAWFFLWLSIQPRIIIDRWKQLRSNNRK